MTDKKLYGINIPRFPQAEIPLVKPALETFPAPADYPWIKVETALGEEASALGQKIGGADLTVTEPPPNVTADLAVACHKLAKPLQKSPGAIATELAEVFTSRHIPFVTTITALPNGYINFELDRKTFGNAVLENIEKEKQDYGNENLGDGKTVVIDCSSPNVAKYMSVGHLRSTVIGESLARIYRAGGYEVVRDNHLGDWGTQFGILGRAKELWGDEIDREMPNADPVQKLYTLYVRISNEIEIEKGGNPDGKSTLEDEGRKWFRKLEEGDPKAMTLLRETTAQSILEFKRVYNLLGADYEFLLGESYYVPMLPQVIQTFVDRGIATVDPKGAAIVEFPEESHIHNLVIQKSDGATVYSTRDLATLIARTAWFSPDRILYVVGGDQIDYFKQVFAAFDRLTEGKGPAVKHVHFGMITLPKKEEPKEEGAEPIGEGEKAAAGKTEKMSTRKGRVIFLEDVLKEAVARAKAKMTEAEGSRNLTPSEIEDISKKVGTGAVIYMDLGQTRDRSIMFDWDQALSLEGNSSTYIQYAYTRGKTVLRKAENEGIIVDNNEAAEFGLPTEVELVKYLAKLPGAIAKAIETNEPSIVAMYVYKTAELFNKFYKEATIIKEPDAVKRNSRLRLTAAASQVIKNGLYLLGIEAPEKM